MVYITHIKKAKGSRVAFNSFAKVNELDLSDIENLELIFITIDLTQIEECGVPRAM